MVDGESFPDPKLGAHVAWILTTCTVVTLAAQQAVTGPYAGTDSVMGRLRVLLTVINFHSETVDAR